MPRTKTKTTTTKSSNSRRDRNRTWIAFPSPDTQVFCWSCLYERQPRTFYWQEAAGVQYSSLQGLLPSPEFPSSLGNAVRAPPPVANLPVTTQALPNLQAVSITKGKFPLQHLYPKSQLDFFFFPPVQFLLYPETRPLTADTVLIFLFSVIPSVAAVSSPWYFKAVRLMLKKPASVSHRQLSQAPF